MTHRPKQTVTVLDQGLRTRTYCILLNLCPARLKNKTLGGDTNKGKNTLYGIFPLKNIIKNMKLCKERTYNKK